MRWRVLSLWVVVAMLAACGGKSVTRAEDGASGGDAGEDSGATSGTNGGGTTGGVGAAGNAPTGGVAGVANGGNSSGGTSSSVPGQAGSPGDALCLSDTSVPMMEFYNDLEGWRVTSSMSDIGAPANPVDPNAIELFWTMTDGMPNLGTMVASIPYSMPSQWVGLGVSLETPLDLTGRELTLCVKLIEGLGDLSDLNTNPGGATLYAKSGAGYCQARGSYQNVGDMAHRGWRMLEFNLARPPDYEDPSCDGPFDPSDIREIGVELNTSSTTRTAQPAAFLVDTLAAVPVLRSEDGASRPEPL